MVIDYGGRTIPWYENIPIGARNYVKEEMPVAPSQDEIQKAIAEQEHYQSRLREGSGFLNDTLGSLSPIKIAAMVAATVSGNAYLIPIIAGADTALQGGSVEDVLKSAAISAATQGVGGEIAGGSGGFTSASETGLPTLAGEGVVSEVGATLLNDVTYPTYDFSPEVPIQNTDQGTYQMGQGTSLSQDAATNRLNPFYSTANPEVSANLNTVSNLVGGGADSNLGTLDQLSGNYLLPLSGGGIGGAELGSIGSIIGSGQGLGQQTLAQVLAPTGLSGISVQDLASDKSVYSSELDVKDALKKANLLRKLLTPQQQATQRTALQNAQASQQQSNMANILRGTQMPQTMTPSIYNQKNPFNFGQQNQPVQDTNALANLLRTA